MAIVIGTHAQAFIDGLNAKDECSEHYTFSVNPGKKYDKIVATNRYGSQHVYAFVDTDGNVYKSAGWNAPAKGVRYTTVEAALEKADAFGGFLYKR